MPNSPLVYGLEDMEAYRDVPVSRIGYQYINDAIAQFVSTYNGMVDNWLGTVVQRNAAWNASPINVMRLPYATDMQPVDEDGKADPVKRALSYEFGLPIARAERAVGTSWERSLLTTVNDLNGGLIDLMQADKRWMMQMTQQALFTNVGWNFKSREEDANVPATIPIVPLANGDTREYPLKTGALTTAQHYTAQAGAMSDAADPFPALATLLGRYASSTRNLVAYVNGTALITAINALTAFEPVLNSRYIQFGNTTPVLNTAIQSNLFFGDKVLGEHHSGIVVNEWSALPDNYIVVMDMGQKPLGAREKPEAVLQGIIATNDVSHYGNELLTRFRHSIGFAVVNPIAAAIHRVSNGTYAIPTGRQAGI